jgi:hypothetical protein
MSREWSVSFYKKDDRRMAFGWSQDKEPTKKEIKEARLYHNAPEDEWDCYISESRQDD